MSFLLEVAKLADWDVNALIVGSGPAALIAFTQVRQQGAEVLAEQPGGGARGRDTAEPGRQPGPGPADGLGPGRGRRSACRVPGRGLDDRATRRPPSPPPRRPGQRGARAGTAVPGARCRGRGGRSAARARAPGRRRASGRHGQPRRAAWRGSTGTAKAWQPTGTGSPATGRPGSRPSPRSPGPRTARCRRRASGPVPGTVARDGQQNQQTVYPDSRTCRPAAPPANTYSNRGTCRQRSPLSVTDVQDTARINLPVHSQTHISVKLIKQSSVAARRCVTYVNSRPPVRGIVSVPCHVLTPSGPCPQARARPAQRGHAAR
jgi:hypothetical protein